MQDTPCTYRISVKAIIKDGQGRVLLGRERDGSWELLGGGLEHGEKPQDCLACEISEEACFTVDRISDRPVAFWTINKESRLANLEWFAFAAYEAEISGDFHPRPTTNDEVQEIRYVSREEAKTLNLHDNTKPYFSG